MLKKKFPKKSLIFSVLLALWISIINIVVLAFGIKNAWPIFFTTIFFYLQGADIKKIKQIFGGGITGILSAWLFVIVCEFLTPHVGGLMAAVIPVVLIIFIIIVLGPLAPGLLNTEAFTFLTVCTINVDMVKGHMLQYALNFIIGGGILLVGAVLINRFVEKKISVPEIEAELG